MSTFLHVQVGEIMSKDVYFVTPDTTIDKVMEVFDSHDFNHLPVIENDQLVGILSKSDMLLLSCAFPLDDPEKRRARDRELFSRMLAGEIMTRQVVRLRPDMLVSVAAGIFLENMFRAMPVVDQQGKLVGILSWIDLLRLAYIPRPGITA
jgi:acetoin utilization protein AcuB